ncbi:MAG TPA: asparagine synthase (glutamine-hydrolyzing) [Acidobacteriota bacterium]|nr:asparagine synthase (glutamine-hydrolyzing) [Acidobacteriota bacterium]HQQ46259.1 asparagine synthase (glutamine-hydrolyzing) [Acidobacteriota bacterium]
MCGICGEYNFRGREPDRGVTARMLSLLSHRGPDDEGSFFEGEIALGHKRLSIIDLSKEASQPMNSRSGRHVLVFNGEIYNFADIRAELESRGEKFSTRSDSEVLLRAYETWGMDFFQKLNGMWAFAIWDRERSVLLLARDKLGKKPLYFAHTRSGIVFASEITPLFSSPDVSKEIDPKALAEQVACRYVLAPKTLFRSVKKLPPGHALTASKNGVKVFPYWKLPLGEPVFEMSDGEAVEEFSRLFSESVRKRLVSDVPLGVLLSGGIDSSAVVAAMRRLGDNEIATFSVGFEEGKGFDERIYASSVARKFGTNHTDFTITPKDFAAGLPEVLRHQDDPVADLAVLPLFYLCREARTRVKVLLSGQGADEVLGGYHFERILRQIKAVSVLSKIPLMGFAARAYSFVDKKRAYLRRWEDIRNSIPGQLPAKMRYDLTMPLDETAMKALFRDPPKPPYDRTLDAFYTEVPSHRGPLDAILGTLIKGWLPDNLLNHGDRMSMANSVEMRCPFLDIDLVKFLFSIPERFKVRSGETKWLLKEWAARAGVPSEVISRPKKGFPVPWNIWLRGPLYGTVEEQIMSASWLRARLNEGIPRKLLREHSEGKDNGLILWNLLILAHWGRIMEIDNR